MATRYGPHWQVRSFGVRRRAAALLPRAGSRRWAQTDQPVSWPMHAARPASWPAAERRQAAALQSCAADSEAVVGSSLQAWATRQLSTLAFLLVFAAKLLGQLPAPHIAYLYPGGGQQGTSFEATAGGEHLEGTRVAQISGAGVQIEVVDFERPLNGEQLNQVRERLQELLKKHGGPPGGKAGVNRPAGASGTSPSTQTTPWTPEDRKEVAELRAKIADTQRRRAAPALAQGVTLRITLAADAPPGRRELRLTTAQGLTNPMAFWVDRLPEFSQPLRQVPVQLGAGGGLALAARAQAAEPQPPLAITLPANLNGQIMPGSTDRYQFHAQVGQTLIVAVKTRSLIPYMSDAVPGWFQATIALNDERGKELASADHFEFAQEPILAWRISQDGEYVLAIHDALYRGREDFVYRIAVGRFPFVTAVFPMGAKRGSRAQIRMSGWNLPSARFAPSSKQLGIHELGTEESGWNANPFLFDVENLPERILSKPAPSSREAMPVKLPSVINGCISQSGEPAFFRINGPAGEEVVAEVLARRLGSPLDSRLSLTDSAGKQLATNDDFVDPSAGLLTHQADSRLAVRLPRKGRYFLRLEDVQNHAGPDYCYRLRISRAHPDFALRVAPSGINLRAGMTEPVSIYAFRQDGFSGPVTLHLKNAHAGLVLSGGLIPPGADSIRATLTAPPQASGAPFPLLVEGEALVDGETVRHLAVPADDMMQAFTWHQLVPAGDSLVLVLGAHRNPLWALDGRSPVKIPLGGTAQVRVGVPRSLASRVQLALNDPPPGISLQQIAEAPGSLVLRLRADAAHAAPGLQGNLIVDASVLPPQDATKPRPAANRPAPLGSLPAIPFEVVGR